MTKYDLWYTIKIQNTYCIYKNELWKFFARYGGAFLWSNLTSDIRGIKSFHLSMKLLKLYIQNLPYNVL